MSRTKWRELTTFNCWLMSLGFALWTEEKFWGSKMSKVSCNNIFWFSAGFLHCLFKYTPFFRIFGLLCLEVMSGRSVVRRATVCRGSFYRASVRLDYCPGTQNLWWFCSSKYLLSDTRSLSIFISSYSFFNIVCFLSKKFHLWPKKRWSWHHQNFSHTHSFVGARHTTA